MPEQFPKKIIQETSFTFSISQSGIYGANHYYDSSIPTPYWATPKTLVLVVKSTDNEHSLIFHKL